MQPQNTRTTRKQNGFQRRCVLPAGEHKTALARPWLTAKSKGRHWLSSRTKPVNQPFISVNQRLNPLRSQRLRVEKTSSGDSELETGRYQVICGRKYDSSPFQRGLRASR